jgi:hemerythrin-like domain-containing protein
MPNRQKSKKETAFTMLKDDHDNVKELFDRFENASTPAEAKSKIVTTVLEELRVHAAVEEQLFYPALRQQMEDEDDLLEEADEEHHVAKILIAELEQMEGHEDNWEAKFMVLAENVRHHIKEEEREIFPQAKKTNIDFVALRLQMAELKETLKSEGIPEDEEAEMVRASGLREESPSKKAQQTVKTPLKAA